MEYKDKWIAALRSGQYMQGKNMLRSDSCYCAIGVLCSILTVEEPDKFSWHKDEDGDWTFVMPYRSCYIQVCNHDGIGVEFESDVVWFDIVRMNDLEGKSFDEIAGYIEAQP